MYHGIIIDQEFKNPSFCETFKVFNKKQAGNWQLYGIEIEDKDVSNTISKIQDNMKDSESWYAHFYNNEELIIIFKEKVFYVKPDKTTWKPVLELGRKLNIPEEQLDFLPNMFQQEQDYFSK